VGNFGENYDHTNGFHAPTPLKQKLIMKLMGSFRIALLSCLLSSALFVNAEETNERSLTLNIFDKCQFSIRQGKHIKLATNSTWDAARKYCFIGLTPLPRNAFSGSIDAYVIDINRYKTEPDSNYAGFFQKPNGEWVFQGTELLLSPKFLKRTFIREQSGDETLMIGYQLIQGISQNGGLTVMPGLRILRINPAFLVSLEANFNLPPSSSPPLRKDYSKPYEALKKELVEMVKSIRITPNVPGPTATSATE
jgi:hypothetical protein